MMSSSSPKRILIAEDEFLIAVLLEENLRESGYDVAGPFSDLTSLLAALDSEKFDCAILDVNLGGQMVYPAVDVLLKRGVPFTLLSGYGNTNTPDAYRGVTVMGKPCEFRDIEAWIKKVTA